MAVVPEPFPAQTLLRIGRHSPHPDVRYHRRYLRQETVESSEEIKKKNERTVKFNELFVRFFSYDFQRLVDTCQKRQNNQSGIYGKDERDVIFSS